MQCWLNERDPHILFWGLLRSATEIIAVPSSSSQSSLDGVISAVINHTQSREGRRGERARLFLQQEKKLRHFRLSSFLGCSHTFFGLDSQGEEKEEKGER